MVLEFLKSDDLEAFKKYSSQELCIKSFMLHLTMKPYMPELQRKIAEIKTDATNAKSFKVFVAIQRIEEAVNQGIAATHLLSKVGSVVDRVEELFEKFDSGDFATIEQVYSFLKTTYGDDLEQFHGMLRDWAFREKNLPFIYFTSKLTNSGLPENVADFNDPRKFDEVCNSLEAVYRSTGNEEDIESMRHSLLLDIFISMDSGEGNVTLKAENANKLMRNLGWDQEEVQASSSTQIETFFGMAMNHVGVNAFYALLEYTNFKRIFFSKEELYTERMAISQNEEMRLESIHFLPASKFAHYRVSYQQIINKLPLGKLAEVMERGVADNNMNAILLLFESSHLKSIGVEVPDEIFYIFATLFDRAYEDDNPEMVVALLKQGILSHDDVEHIVNQHKNGSMKSNIYQAMHRAVIDGDIEKFDIFMLFVGSENINIPLNENGETAYQIALKSGDSELAKHIFDTYHAMHKVVMDGDIEYFDKFMELIGLDKINIPLNEDRETAFQIVLKSGDSKFAKHIIDTYLVSPSLQEEALLYVNELGENALHDVSPELDMDVLAATLKLEGATEALEEEVDNPESIVDGLAPILSIVAKNISRGVEIVRLYAKAGADIFVTDKEGIDLSAWVAYVVDEEEAHPLSDLHKRFEERSDDPIVVTVKRDAKLDIIITCLDEDQADSDTDGRSGSVSSLESSDDEGSVDEIFIKKQSCMDGDFGQSFGITTGTIDIASITEIFVAGEANFYNN